MNSKGRRCTTKKEVLGQIHKHKRSRPLTGMSMSMISKGSTRTRVDRNWHVLRHALFLGSVRYSTQSNERRWIPRQVLSVAFNDLSSSWPGLDIPMPFKEIFRRRPLLTHFHLHPPAQTLATATRQEHLGRIRQDCRLNKT
jgi:hypothetical protein